MADWSELVKWDRLNAWTGAKLQESCSKVKTISVGTRGRRTEEHCAPGIAEEHGLLEADHSANRSTRWGHHCPTSALAVIVIRLKTTYGASRYSTTTVGRRKKKEERRKKKEERRKEERRKKKEEEERRSSNATGGTRRTADCTTGGIRKNLGNTGWYGPP